MGRAHQVALCAHSFVAYCMVELLDRKKARNFIWPCTNELSVGVQHIRMATANHDMSWPHAYAQRVHVLYRSVNTTLGTGTRVRVCICLCHRL
jgi:hypothetical protein